MAEESLTIGTIGCPICMVPAVATVCHEVPFLVVLACPKCKNPLVNLNLLPECPIERIDSRVMMPVSDKVH